MFKKEQPKSSQI